MNKLNETIIGGAYGGLDPTMGAMGSNFTSHNVQKGNYGYTYQILPLTTNLQQKVYKQSYERYIYPGCTVRGVGYKDKENRYSGQVYRIVKDSEGKIKYLYVRTPKTNKFVTVAADDNLELVVYETPNKRPKTMMMRESLTPVSQKELNNDDESIYIEIQTKNILQWIRLNDFSTAESAKDFIKDFFCFGNNWNVYVNDYKNIPHSMYKSNCWAMLSDNLWEYMKSDIPKKLKDNILELFGEDKSLNDLCAEDKIVIFFDCVTLEEVAMKFVDIYGYPINYSYYFDYELYGKDILAEMDEEDAKEYDGMSLKEVGGLLTDIYLEGKFDNLSSEDRNYYFDYEGYGKDLSLMYTIIQDGKHTALLFND